MSSHHVIRENQEPALLLWDKEATHMDVVLQLLEWSPVVAVHASVLDQLLSYGIKIDVVFCKPEISSTLKEQLLEQEPVKVVGIAQNSLTNALTFMHQSGAHGVNVLANPVKTTLEQLELHASNLKTVLYARGESYVLVQDTYEKWVPEGTVIKLFTDVGAGVATHGFTKDLNAHVLGTQVLLTKAAGRVFIKVNIGTIWVVEELS